MCCSNRIYLSLIDCAAGALFLVLSILGVLSVYFLGLTWVIFRSLCGMDCSISVLLRVFLKLLQVCAVCVWNEKKTNFETFENVQPAKVKQRKLEWQRLLAAVRWTFSGWGVKEKKVAVACSSLVSLPKGQNFTFRRWFCDSTIFRHSTPFAIRLTFYEGLTVLRRVSK